MIRVAARQFRTEAIVGVALLVAAAVVLAVTGAHLAHVFDAFESQCKAATTCASASNPVQNVDRPLQGALPIVVIATPALLGLFFGAPLIARELESGTYRLAWTQSVTRERWLAVKLGLVGAFAMAVAGLLTWMVDWWAHPLMATNGMRFGPAIFSIQGVVPIGYAGPRHVSVPNGWVYSTSLVDKSGRAPTAQYVAHACPAVGQGARVLAASGGQPGIGPSNAQIQACIAKLSSSIHTVITDQPASRFWPFQLAEMGIFLAAVLALCGLAYWWLRRRYA